MIDKMIEVHTNNISTKHGFPGGFAEMMISIADVGAMGKNVVIHNGIEVFMGMLGTTPPLGEPHSEGKTESRRLVMRNLSVRSHVDMV